MIVAKACWDLKPVFKKASEIHSAVGLFITYQSVNSSLLETLKFTFGIFLLTLFMMSTRLDWKIAPCKVLGFVIIFLPYISTILILVLIIVKLTPNRPIAEGKENTFTCTAPGHESISSYLWKLNDTTIPGVNKEKYSFTPSREQNGRNLSCTAITAANVTSEESQIKLQVFCK